MNLIHAQQMMKVSCFIHKKYVEHLISALGEYKIIHLTEVKFDNPIKYETSEEIRKQYQEISSLLSRINSIYTKLGMKQKVFKETDIKWEETNFLINETKNKIEEIEKKIKEIDIAAQDLELDQKISIPRLRLQKTKFKIMRIDIAKEFDEALQYLLVRLTAKKLIFERIDDMPHTREIYFFEGWITKERLKEFSECIQKESEGFGGLIHKVETETNIEQSTKYVGNPPSLLKYPRITGVFGSFAAITRAFGVPDYHEIDPTSFFLITFPLLFGMMYGDIGHGIMLFVGAFIIYSARNRFSFSKGSILNYVIQGTPLVMFCAVSSIIFGFLYGEMFGSEEWFVQLTGLKNALWFSPMHHPNSLLRYSLYVGIIQISFGMIIDVWNKVAGKQYKETLFGTLPWLLFYFSFSYLLITRGWGMADVLYEPITLSLFVILPFVFMIIGRIYLEGIMGVNKAFEQLLTSFSHTISYARIMALKLISITFSQMLLPSSIIGFIPFFLGTLFLITIFETMLIFLHTLRLHWIEWFSKFYEGTGIQFKPFKLTE